MKLSQTALQGLLVNRPPYGISGRLYFATDEETLYIDSGLGWTVISATQSIVHARYSSNAGQSIPHDTWTVFNYEDKEIDTHNAVVTGASWTFTAPRSGTYIITHTNLFTSTSAWAAGEIAVVGIFSGVTPLAYIDRPTSESSTNKYLTLKGTTTLYLAQGTTITIKGYQGSGGALAFYAGAEATQWNWIDIVGLPSSSSSAQSLDGWVSVNEVWTYASATTINVSAGALTRYSKGDRIKFTQTTVKYFVVVDVADALLTVTGGTDYAVANTAITDIYYSHALSPIGYPGYFNFTETITADGGSTPPTYTGTVETVFSINGKVCNVLIYLQNSSGGTPGSGGGNLFGSVPVPIAKGIALGSGVSYEAGGTMKNIVCNLGTTTTFYMSYDLNNILANDQSSAARFLRMNIQYMI